jgi:hypothetical protein
MKDKLKEIFDETNNLIVDEAFSEIIRSGKCVEIIR